jgi:hypothetical protein
MAARVRQSLPFAATMNWPRLGLTTGGFCRDFAGTWGALNKFTKHTCLRSSTTTARVTSAKRFGKPPSPDADTKARPKARLIERKPSGFAS